MNAQVGRLSTDEAQLGGCLGLDSVRTDNGDRLLQLCADHNLFLCSTNFRNKRSRLATWCPPTAGQPWTQIDHVAISYRWRGSVTDCRSYWNTSVDSDHALVRCRFSLKFPREKKSQTQRIAVEKHSDLQIKDKFKKYLNQTIPDDCTCEVGSFCNAMCSALQKATTIVCGTVRSGVRNHWISGRTVALLQSRRKIPVNFQSNSNGGNSFVKWSTAIVHIAKLGGPRKLKKRKRQIMLETCEDYSS